ncbi:hypothetical protein MMC13_006300 [Lambiella insularis]|nr:hypothetical protein [Lambiella insularis]
MDALQSFVFLTENLPIWVAKLHELSRQVAERHAEFTKLSQTSSFTSIRRKKNCSTESLRPNDASLHDNIPLPTPEPLTSPNRVEIKPDSKHIFQQYREEKLRRKRKSGSIASGASGPQRFRTRMSMIVYYDSAIQDGFEMLVRNVASARNNLRKGKLAASFKARLTAMGVEESPFGDHGIIQLRHPNIPQLPKSRNGPYTTEGDIFDAFDLVDKNLETAQSLCEVGAHQFLRDGNCADEIAGTKEQFENCLLLARQHVVVLHTQKAKETEAEEQRQRQAMLSQQPPDRVMHVDEASLGSRKTNITLASSGAIEVDDASDTSSVHVDLTAFRSTRRQ